MKQSTIMSILLIMAALVGATIAYSFTSIKPVTLAPQSTRLVHFRARLLGTFETTIVEADSAYIKGDIITLEDGEYAIKDRAN